MVGGEIPADRIEILAQLRFFRSGDARRYAGRKLAMNRRVLCASPDYLSQHGTPRTPADLAEHDCLLLVGSQGDRMCGIVMATVAKSPSVQGRFESNPGKLLRDAVVAAGPGIALHSIWHVHEELRAQRPQVALPNYLVAETGTYAVMPQRRLVPPGVRAFVDFLAERLGVVPPWERTRHR